MSESNPHEFIHLTGDELLQRVRQLIHEGNVRRIRIHHLGQTVLELPLTLGVAGAVFMPVLAAVGALAALITDCTIEVEKRPEAAAEKTPPAPSPPAAMDAAVSATNKN